MSVPQSFRLHSTTGSFLIEPLGSASSDCLEIDRVSGHFARRQVRPSYNSKGTTEEIFGIFGIVRLNAGPYLIVITDRKRVGRVAGSEVWRVAGTKLIPFVRARLSAERERDEERFLKMIRLVLRTPNFYFSHNYDLTNSMQRNFDFSTEDKAKPVWERVDERFFWNKYLLKDFIANQLDDFILPIMLGFIQIESNSVKGTAFDYILISRRNIKRAGTRFHVRGVDDNGQVANNIETEQICYLPVPDRASSFVQTRGSIPVFWSQPVNIKYTPRPKILAHDHETLSASSLHFQEQVRRYGDHVLINLVNTTGSEMMLAQAYKKQVEMLNDDKLRYIHFDFHHECRKDWSNVEKLVEKVTDDLQNFGFFLGDMKSGKELAKQEGTFRTNCMDNLDRTNVVQSVLAERTLQQQLQRFGLFGSHEKLSDHPSLHSVFKNIWANNADTISLQYAGTGALKTDFTRTGKRTMQGALKDGLNSVTRYYLNNFKDGFRQDAFDLFLGNYLVEDHRDAPSPFSGTFRPIATVTFIFALLIGTVMFLASLVAPEAGTSLWYQILVMLFWLGALGASAKVILLYGRDLVDKPQLCEYS